MLQIVLKTTDPYSYRCFVGGRMELLKIELETELKKRREKNPNYSLRRFAQVVGVNSGTLSQILTGKRSLSLEIQNKIWAKLGKPPVQQFSSKEKTEPLQSDIFQMIADWSHFAVLELFELRDYQPDTKWMGRKLGLSPFEISLALERLVRIGLLEPKDSFYKVTKKNLSTLGLESTNSALRSLQKQILLKSIEALECMPIEVRDQSTLTIALPKKALPELKKRITQFRRDMNSWISEMKNKDEVYQLTISLFPTNSKINGERK